MNKKERVVRKFIRNSALIILSLLIVGVFCFKYVTKEQEYIPSENSNAPPTKKECIKSAMQMIIDAFKSLDYGVFSAFLIVFFGWLDWGSFVDNFLSLHQLYQLLFH